MKVVGGDGDDVDVVVVVDWWRVEMVGVVEMVVEAGFGGDEDEEDVDDEGKYMKGEGDVGGGLRG